MPFLEEFGEIRYFVQVNVAVEIHSASFRICRSRQLLVCRRLAVALRSLHRLKEVYMLLDLSKNVVFGIQPRSQFLTLFFSYVLKPLTVNHHGNHCDVHIQEHQHGPKQDGV